MGLQVEEISHWTCLRGAGKPDVAEHKREEQSCPECCPEQDGRPELPLRCLVVEEERADDDSPEPSEKRDDVQRPLAYPVPAHYSEELVDAHRSDARNPDHHHPPLDGGLGEK